MPGLVSMFFFHSVYFLNKIKLQLFFENWISYFDCIYFSYPSIVHYKKEDMFRYKVLPCLVKTKKVSLYFRNLEILYNLKPSEDKNL